jgi:hypothetical protein
MLLVLEIFLINKRIYLTISINKLIILLETIIGLFNFFVVNSLFEIDIQREGFD